MPFPKRLLTEGEEIVLDLRQHWVTLARPIATTLLILGIAIAIAVGLSRTSMSTGTTLWLGLTGAAVILWSVTALRRILSWATTRFVLTNERLITRSGVVAKRSKEIPLEAINDVAFSQTVFGRLVGAGTLLVESAGERGQERVTNVRRPEEIQKAIYRASEARKGLRAPVSSGSVADEIAKLASLRDSGAITAEEYEARKERLLRS